MGLIMKNITKKYNEDLDNESIVLDNISCNINNGEMLAIIGKSGAGKSTLLHIIGCLDIITSGEYFIDDIEVNSLNPSERAELRNSSFGFVMQDIGFMHHFSDLKFLKSIRKSILGMVIWVIIRLVCYYFFCTRMYNLL